MANGISLINVTTLAPDHDRPLLARWALLGYELSVLKARSLVDTTEGKKYLQISKLIVEGEWESMVNGDRHTTVWYWIQSKACQLNKQGDIDSFQLQTLCNAVTLSRDKANDMMSCIDRDQPPPYVFVCAILINISECYLAYVYVDFIVITRHYSIEYFYLPVELYVLAHTQTWHYILHREGSCGLNG